MSLALHQRRLFCCLVAVLLVTSGMAATVVSATPEPPVTFTDDFPMEQRGDVAEIGVRFSDAEVATVRVGSGSNHIVTATVRDTDDDGRANLRLNTYDGSVAVSDGDAIAVHRLSNVTTPLDVGKYDLDLWKENGTDGERWAVGTLVVSERSTDSLRTWVAPESADLSAPSAIHAARSSGNLTRSDTVAENDTLVLELRAAGLEGVIAAQDGRNATIRFFEFLKSENASLVVYDVPDPEQKRAYLNLTDPSAVTAVSDPRNDTYYLAVEPRNLRVTDDDGGKPTNNRKIWGWQRANFTLSGESILTTDGRETATIEFEIRDAEASLDTPDEIGRAYFAPRPNQSISGVTNLAPGHHVTVDVRGPDGDVRSKTIRVRNATETPGRFATTFDLRDVPAGTNVSIVVRSDGRSLLRTYPNYDEAVSGYVLAIDATVNLTDRGLTEQGVLVENAVLSHGGYLAVHRGSADGEVITRSEFLAPGEEFGQFVDFGGALDSNATLVVVAHRDGPDDALGEPYTENGSVVADSIEFTVEQETTTSVSTERRTTTATDATTVETRTPSPNGDVPGFDVGATLVALLAGVLIARKS